MNLQSEIKRTQSEVQRLDELKNTYAATLKTNDQQILTLTKDLTRATNQVETLRGRVKQYERARAQDCQRQRPGGERPD